MKLGVDRGFTQPTGRFGSSCPVRLDLFQRRFGFYKQTEEIVFGYTYILASCVEIGMKALRERRKLPHSLGSIEETRSPGDHQQQSGKTPCVQFVNQLS